MARPTAAEIADRIRTTVEQEREVRQARREQRKAQQNNFIDSMLHFARAMVVMNTDTGRLPAARTHKRLPWIEELRAKATKVPGCQSNKKGVLARSW